VLFTEEYEQEYQLNFYRFKLFIHKMRVSNNLIMFLAILLIATSLTQIWAKNKQPTMSPITGKAYGTVEFTVLTEEPLCLIELKPGWNYISLCANPENYSINNIFNDVDFRYVMEWNESSQEFMIYSPRASVNPFEDLNKNKSYFVYAEFDDNLAILGDDSDDENRSLTEGWNPPSYPYRFTANITKYLETVNESYRYVMKWDNVLQGFMIYSPRAAVNPFETISKGEGQFIYAVENATLKYNKTYLES